jgi:hypothetical protein
MKSKPISLGLLLLLLFLIAATPSWASTVLSPTDIVHNDAGTYGPSWPAINMINGSGLGRNPFTSGVTDWDTYFAGNPTHETGGSCAWFSDGTSLTGNLTFDLGGTWFIDKIALWNESWAGVSRFEVWFDDDTDRSNGYVVEGAWPPARADGLVPLYSAEIFDLGGSYEAAYVHLRLTGTDMGWAELISVGEIAVSATHAPAPPAVFLLFSGLLGLASYRRFNR